MLNLFIEDAHFGWSQVGLHEDIILKKNRSRAIDKHTKKSCYGVSDKTCNSHKQHKRVCRCL
jgi:hypothetical protein